MIRYRPMVGVFMPECTYLVAPPGERAVDDLLRDDEAGTCRHRNQAQADTATEASLAVIPSVARNLLRPLPGMRARSLGRVRSLGMTGSWSLGLDRH